MKVTYYIAICVFLVCLAAIVIKMTFWPACVGNTACDGWTVAGLSATILGVLAGFLGILGAILLAAWWTGLDERVEKRVVAAFSTQVQTLEASLQTSLNNFAQLTNQTQQLQAKADAIFASTSAQDQTLQANAKEIKDLAALAQAIQSKAEETLKKQASTTSDLKKVTDAMIALNPQVAVVLAQHESEEKIEP